MIRKYVRNILSALRIVESYIYDISRYIKFSGSLGKDTDVNLMSKIIEKYHVLEKGLSMKGSMPGYGERHFWELIDLLESYSSNFGCESNQFKIACEVAHKYLEFNADTIKNFPLACNRIKNISKMFEGEFFKECGASEVYKEDIFRASEGAFDAFCKSRHSFRDYSADDIRESDILESIELAQSSPSVCNRQSARVYYSTCPDTVSLALSHQNGNKGFGHLAKGLLIVTSDLQSFKGAHERNQALIDAGLFSMSLLYGLHYKKLAACPLNWCVAKDKDKLMRKDLRIPDSEVVAMMISVGHFPDKFKVAKSNRFDVSEISRRLEIFNI